jgi:hypothetical protein
MSTAFWISTIIPPSTIFETNSGTVNGMEVSPFIGQPITISQKESTQIHEHPFAVSMLHLKNLLLCSHPSSISIKLKYPV